MPWPAALSRRRQCFKWHSAMRRCWVHQKLGFSDWIYAEDLGEAVLPDALGQLDLAMFWDVGLDAVDEPALASYHPGATPHQQRTRAAGAASGRIADRISAAEFAREGVWGRVLRLLAKT